MAQLDQLIRVKKWNLDIARRELVELEQMRDDIKERIDRIEKGLVEEQILASKSGLLTNYGDYAKKELNRRDCLSASLTDIELQVKAKLEEIQMAFEELKTVEIAADRAAERRAFKLRRREQMTLDDIAGQRAFRNAS